MQQQVRLSSIRKQLNYRSKIRKASSALERCGLCELQCDVNRIAGEHGRCGLGSKTFLYKKYSSANEEPELLPALRLFLSACSMRCSFCDEAPRMFRPDYGIPVEAVSLAGELHHAVTNGIKTISILGGEPTLHIHTILAIAAAAPRRLPLAINSNMYMTPLVIELLDGVIDWYLADFKFGNDHCAERVAGVPNYTAIVQRNLKLAAAGTNVIVRHLLLPGHEHCCFRPLVDWLDAHLPGIRFQLYAGYVPCGKSGANDALGRLLTPAEVCSAQEYLAATSLNAATSGVRATVPATPLVHQGDTEVSVTLGIDGRVYCHDLSPEVSTVLTQI